jgi:hypothetical protein
MAARRVRSTRRLEHAHDRDACSWLGRVDGSGARALADRFAVMVVVVWIGHCKTGMDAPMS